MMHAAVVGAIAVASVGCLEVDCDYRRCGDHEIEECQSAPYSLTHDPCPEPYDCAEVESVDSAVCAYLGAADDRCAPPDAPEFFCDGDMRWYCDGSYGFAVFNHLCPECTTEGFGPICQGGLFDDCVSDDDCAQTLACLADGNRRLCTRACDEDADCADIVGPPSCSDQGICCSVFGCDL